MQGRPTKILNVASTAGITSRPGWLAYAAVEGCRRVAVADAGRRAGGHAASRSTASRRAGPRRSCGASWRPEEDPASIMQPDAVADVIAQLMRDTERDPRRTEHHRPPADLIRRMNRLEYRLASAAPPAPRHRCSICSRPSGGGSSSRPRACPHLDGNLALPPRGDPAGAPDPRVVHAAGAVQLRPRRQARLPRPAGPRDVPPADVGPVRRRQRLPAGPRRAAPAWHHGRPGLACRRARSSASGLDTHAAWPSPERTFLHRHYDFVVCAGEASRGTVRGRAPDAGRARAAARRAADGLLLRPGRAGRGPRPGAGRYPALAGRPRGPLRARRSAAAAGKRAAPGLDAARLRAALPADHASR